MKDFCSHLLACRLWEFGQNKMCDIVVKTMNISFTCLFTEYVVLKIPIDVSSASPFSVQILNGMAGPTLSIICSLDGL